MRIMHLNRNCGTFEANADEIEVFKKLSVFQRIPLPSIAIIYHEILELLKILFWRGSW